MAQGKFGERLIILKCSICKAKNHYARKNKKLVERKIEFKKFCKKCRKHTIHKETKLR